MKDFRRAGWFERFGARWLGIAVLRSPDPEWSRDPILDFIMAYHYCRDEQRYRFDRCFDPISKTARFTCGHCGQTYAVSEGIGMLLFHLRECALAAARDTKDKTWHLALTLKYLFLGLGKHLPQDRGGKTAGELEYEAGMYFMCASIQALNRSGPESTKEKGPVD